jgi:hypothetical protein
MVSKTQHSSAIIDYIKRRAKWSDATFTSVTWEAHSMAMSSLKRVTQLRIIKLAHALYHTNYEAKKMYGTTDICPCCQQAVETFSHVFQCRDPDASTHRVSEKSLLETSLSSNTPKQLTRMLLHGLEQWEAMETISTSPKLLFRGCLAPAEIALIQAFHNQSAIGWDHLLRGMLSKHWEHTYNALTPMGAIPSTIWAKTVIVHLWTYSMSLWKFCNGVVHGHTMEETKRKESQQLQTKIQQEYAAYHLDKYIVSPKYSFLFTKKTLQERLFMDRYSMSSWLATVTAAKAAQSPF